MKNTTRFYTRREWVKNEFGPPRVGSINLLSPLGCVGGWGGGRAQQQVGSI